MVDSLGQLQLFYFWNGLTGDHLRLADNKGAVSRGSSNGDAKSATTSADSALLNDKTRS
jgi:hypothetical protein